MGIGLDEPASWRGWEHDHGSAKRIVTAARLRSPGDSPSRLFPKIRSWLALDSPLELLSPLSVLRVNFAFGAIAFTVVGCLGSTTRADVVASLVVGMCTLAIWVLLLVKISIAPNPGRVLSFYWTGVVGVLMLAAGSGRSAAVIGFLLVPSAVFVSMFFGLRIVLWQLAWSLLALWLAFTAGHGVAVGLLLAVIAVTSMATAPLAVLMVSRASRRSGLVDPETGLPNAIGLAKATGDLPGRHVHVAVVSLSGVGECREALGYSAAAELLRRAVEYLGEIVPTGARIGRVEGDAVVVVIDRKSILASHSDDTSVGTELARSLVAAISAGRYLVGEIEVTMQAHVGLAESPKDGDRLADLIRRASLSAREAVRLGVPSCAWDGDRDAMTVEDLNLLASLRGALDNGELSLHYQPQFVGEPRSMVSAEALLRWDHPVLGWIPPDRFIVLAERTGLIDRVTRWVIAEALDAQVRWRDRGIYLPVSVNVSAKNLADPGLPGWVIEALDVRLLQASCLTVEVTESAVTDPDQARAVLGPLRDYGIRISIDDFGTGYTSLSALPELPVDELKIDQGFVLRSLTSSADDAIVATMCDLGHRLGLTVVAEGVEDAVTEARLLAHGVDLFQDFHLARPLPETALLDLVESGSTALVGRV
jgi:EAL domain-containing protein (putative c-di-GMP-specific phosphodiesterase class I)/GGDEF domain-containing protein